MTSLEKFNQLVEIDQKKGKAKITTVRGEVYYCKPLGFAEDEDDWAYDFFTPDYPTKHFILSCNFIDTIEEVDEDEWKQHLKQKEIRKKICELGLKNGHLEKPTQAINVAKYILEIQGAMSTWKLQKLCYYAQAWHYTWTGKRLITEDVQSWINGPVFPELYALHKGKKYVTANDFAFADTTQLSPDAKDSIDIILEHYGSLEPEELVKLTHTEEPWLKARGDLPPDAKCDNIITLDSMGEYYRKHLI